MGVVPAKAKYWASVTILVVTALSCHSERSSSPNASALIRDGFNDNGNPFFFWLAPLLNQQAPTTQVLSSQSNPTITVKNLCNGSLVRAFSGSDVVISEGQFHVNWATTDDNLDPGCTYRLAVTAGARELGIADVDVLNSGNELRNAQTGEFIPLLDGRTLPIRFFIGIGSQCQSVNSDCGEGVVQPGTATTIVTKQGQAGVAVPVGAVNEPVMIVIESVDDRPCILGLPEPVFPGSIGPTGNACYDFHTEPPLAEINPAGKFNTKVTVGICPQVGDLEHATQELLQIFQLHLGSIFALQNVPAPFLRCDPGYPGSLGARRSPLEIFAAGLRSLIIPRPLYASTTAVLDMGTGGETEMFSRFTWALPSQLDLNFDQGPDLSAILPGAIVNTLYARLGVTFSRPNALLGECPGSAVYANEGGISPCPLGIAPDFSEDGLGAIQASFAIPAAEACISAKPTGYRGLFPPPGGVAFLEALGADGAVLGRLESTTERTYQRLCVRATGIAAVRFAGTGSAYAMFDDIRWTRVLPVN